MTFFVGVVAVGWQQWPLDRSPHLQFIAQVNWILDSELASRPRPVIFVEHALWCYQVMLRFGTLLCWTAWAPSPVGFRFQSRLGQLRIFCDE
ncbi:hypothetical protein BV22DRAFT_640099 [Leucogyrophana mollusca]|uniref:Uncharacterized protein n=1 Tax=Leucogyrophana mollusca TaxID=85980 RepID=A0ACB8BB30_9AGAM|nr:hypothetical protein BV22DRAFT_640099 [Leucogyrophana mollusca]